MLKNKELADFLIRGCMAQYDTETGEIAHIDPGDNTSREGLENIIDTHPELEFRMVADGLNAYLKADFSDKRYIPLSKLLE